MCGLLGFISAHGDAGALAPAFGPALHDMRHRGPDDDGVWSDDDVVLGFRRLSIIDIENSHQPLAYADERYHIVFNGEIYNYVELRERLTSEFGARFHTDGDTETIVAGYHHLGPSIIGELRGMFAFVIWDSHEKVAFGGRDPFGIKPLFTLTDERGTFFASEKKSLMDLAPERRAVDTRALQHYLELQYVPEPATLTAGIERVQSGTSFTLRPGAAPAYDRYFRPDFRPQRSSDPEALYRRIAEALEDSVAKHMRADVTVGAFLSGGIDSTAIAALAKRHNPDLLTFTTGFEREGYSEIDVAAESARAIGVEHITKVVTPQEMMDILPLIVWYLDDPVADPALVPLYFIAREARKHVKVVLSGEGADELFGGYTIYHEAISLAPFDKVPGPLRRGLGKAATVIPEGVRGKDLLRRGSKTLEQRYYGNARIFRPEEMGFLRSFDPAVGHADVTAEHYAATTHLDGSTRMQYIDLFTWLRGDILVKADKMTMANSLELRVPFLDTVVFEAAAGLAVDEKLTQGTTKFALRRAMELIVPAHVLNRPKLGFPVPIRHWLKDEMYDWARSIVNESQADALIDKDAVLRMIDAHRAGPHDHSRKIWTVLVFLLWHGIFVEDRIHPDVPETVYPVQV
ncbi:asparagine synthase (glutamine-hydrolyzing) [Phycicoccus duodecadis]|jgi:asparagine synthase (glutamine-hydrolysing)|uniref:asparagine synthase (glutamine-hydrolyzing) n=1 Tax=Phycicoccus duodecadis TaxID=173053 RepID=A0A2N3YMM0_9MICO|nr:asparagine synthase (glutamine-hydrolyzing) [Phycicoccus duodecadis]PKW28111.1 asparagine synthase (glutamine-hydrolysing) [Phycicoccus duodecadis]